MAAAARAGILYFAIVFTCGFLLGVLRVLALAPWLGELLAVAVELPIMLAISWVVCGWLIRAFLVPGGHAARLVMGGLAFGLLMIAEAAIADLAFGQSLSEHLSRYAHASALLGLAGQALFGLFPLLQQRENPLAG